MFRFLFQGNGRVGYRSFWVGDHALALVVVPQRAEKFRHGQAVGVVPDQAQHEDAVRLKVVVDEADHVSPRRFVLGVVKALHQT